MNDELYDRYVAAWHLDDAINFDTLKGATVEYFVTTTGGVIRCTGVFKFTIEGESDSDALLLLTIHPPLLGGSNPRQGLAPVFPPQVIREIEVHPQQEVAKFLVRKSFDLRPEDTRH